MRNTVRGSGRIEPILYFVNRIGHIILAHHTEQPTPAGYDRREATTMHDATLLSHIMRLQQEAKFAGMDAAAMEKRKAFFEGCIERARATLRSSETSQHEKDFLRHKIIPQWQSQITEVKHFRDMYFHQEAFEAGHGQDEP